MHTSWDTRDDAPHYSGASNNVVIIALLLVLAFGYFGCVRPMAEQVRAMRVSMACLQSRVARLVSEADTAGEGAGLLTRLAEQRAATQQATTALDEIEALNRRLAERTRQIALLATSEDLATRTAKRVAEHRELLGAAERALRDASSVEQRLAAVERQITTAASAADRMKALCGGLIATRAMVDDAHLASEDMAALQQRLILAARHAPAAAQAADRLTQLTGRLANTQHSEPAAARRLTQLEALESRLAAAGDQSARAAEALESLTDLRNDVANAEPQFQHLREVVLQVVLMQPAVDRAVATLTPIRELATLRHLDVEQLQVAAKALRLSAEGTIAK